MSRKKEERVKVANDINTDYTNKVKHIQCLTCRMGCVDFEFALTGKCIHYEKRLSLREIDIEIKIQNINIKRLCVENNLKYHIMKDMLNNKLALSYKYYYVLEKRIMEKEIYLEYI